MRNALATLAAIITTAALAEDVTYFHGRDARSEIAAFVGVRAGKTLTLEGDGGCSVTISWVGDSLKLSPEFEVTAKRSTDMNGGYTSTELWSSYFIDDPGSLLPGQFGTSYEVKFDRDAGGKPTKYEFAKVRQQDLGYQRLKHVVCKNLRAR